MIKHLTHVCVGSFIYTHNGCHSQPLNSTRNKQTFSDHRKHGFCASLTQLPPSGKKRNYEKQAPAAASAGGNYESTGQSYMSNNCLPYIFMKYLL